MHLNQFVKVRNYTEAEWDAFVAGWLAALEHFGMPEQAPVQEGPVWSVVWSPSSKVFHLYDPERDGLACGRGSASTDRDGTVDPAKVKVGWHFEAELSDGVERRLCHNCSWTDFGVEFKRATEREQWT